MPPCWLRKKMIAAASRWRFFFAPKGRSGSQTHINHWEDHALFPVLGGGRALRSGSGSWVATSSIRVGERFRKAFQLVFQLMRYNPLLNYTKLDAILWFSLRTHHAPKSSNQSPFSTKTASETWRLCFLLRMSKPGYDMV